MAVPSWGLLPCARASAQTMARRKQPAPAPVPPCDTCHCSHSCLGILEAVQKGCTPGSTQCSPHGKEGAAGILLGVPWERRHSLGRCWLEPQRQETGGQRALCPQWFLSRHTGCLPAFVRSTKRGNSVPSRIANQAALAATATATCAPLRATMGSSGAGRLVWAGERTAASALHRCPQPVWHAIVVLLPFPQEASRHGWVQPDAVSRRWLPSVSSLLIQPQLAFPDSARACSGTPLGQACLGQRCA